MDHRRSCRDLPHAHLCSATVICFRPPSDPIQPLFCSQFRETDHGGTQDFRWEQANLWIWCIGEQSRCNLRVLCSSCRWVSCTISIPRSALLSSACWSTAVGGSDIPRRCIVPQKNVYHMAVLLNLIFLGPPADFLILPSWPKQNHSSPFWL